MGNLMDWDFIVRKIIHIKGNLSMGKKAEKAKWKILGGKVYMKVNLIMT